MNYIKIIQSFGLILDIIGVLFTLRGIFYNPNIDWIKPAITMVEMMSQDISERNVIDGKNRRWVKVGVGLIVVGFIFQLIGLWL